MEMHKKYPTRYQFKKVENAVDRLRLVFEAVDKFMNLKFEDEVKEALQQELRLWEDGEEGVKKKMAAVLKKHLAGEELDDEQTTVEQMTADRFHLEKTATPLKSDTLLSTPTPRMTAQLHMTMKTPETRKTATPLATAEILNETAHDIRRRKTMKFSARPSATPTPTTSATSQFSPSTPLSFLSRRASSSSVGLAQMILRRNSFLDQSVICLGSPKRSPVETITLDSSPETTPAKAPLNLSDVLKDRRSVPMALSSPQSPWPSAKATIRRPE